MIIRDIASLKNSSDDQWDGTDIEPGHPRNTPGPAVADVRPVELPADYPEDDRSA